MAQLSKRKKLLFGYYAPGVLALLRLVVTIWFFGWSHIELPLRYIQLVPLCALLVTQFTYFKLYRDGVPVISLILPSMLHFVIILVALRRVIITPFVLLLVIDIGFLVARGVKANLFPFSVDEDEEELDAMLDLSEETG